MAAGPRAPARGLSPAPATPLGRTRRPGADSPAPRAARPPHTAPTEALHSHYYARAPPPSRSCPAVPLPRRVPAPWGLLIFGPRTPDEPCSEWGLSSTPPSRIEPDDVLCPPFPPTGFWKKGAATHPFRMTGPAQALGPRLLLGVASFLCVAGPYAVSVSKREWEGGRGRTRRPAASALPADPPSACRRV